MNVETIYEIPWIVRASGEIDLFNVEDLRRALEEAVSGSPGGIVVDLSDVSYIDSAGIAALLSTYRRISSINGSLALVVTRPVIRKVLAIIHMELLPGIHICDHLSSAQSLFSAQNPQIP